MIGLRKAETVERHSHEANKEETDNKKRLLDIFDSEAGYYQWVIRPSLEHGKDDEFLELLKHLGVIKEMQLCRNRISGKYCATTMLWTHSRGQDLYVWKCSKCSMTTSIRDGSLFYHMKCSLKNGVRILSGWCRGSDIDMMSNLLGVPSSVVVGVYNKAANMAENFIQNNITKWQIGGLGVVVLIDTFPEGCTNINTTRGRKGQPILCMTEVRRIPQKYWLEPLNRYNNSRHNIKSVREHILKSIRRMVRPGSTLIFPQDSPLFCDYDGQSLRSVYPTMKRVGQLARYNTEQQNVSLNLEIIWKSVLNICEEAQFYNCLHVKQFIIGKMWTKEYPTRSLEVLLHQIDVTMFLVQLADTQHVM